MVRYSRRLSCRCSGSATVSSERVAMAASAAACSPKGRPSAALTGRGASLTSIPPGEVAPVARAGRAARDPAGRDGRRPQRAEQPGGEAGEADREEERRRPVERPPPADGDAAEGEQAVVGRAQ